MYLLDPCDTYPQISSSSPTPVQVFDSEWQYLCGEGFTIENTEVVCRENAQTDAITSLSTPLLSERRQYSIANNVYTCTGSEQSLCECPSVNTTCDTDMIAVVRCYFPGMRWLSINIYQLCIQWSNVISMYYTYHWVYEMVTSSNPKQNENYYCNF